MSKWQNLIQKSSVTLSRTTFFNALSNALSSTKFSKETVQSWQSKSIPMLFFRSLGLVLKLEWVCMLWKLQKFVYSYEYFKTVRSKTYYALNTSTRAVNNSSALLLIFVLCPCFICSFGKQFWNQIMNKQQIQKSSFTLRQTTFFINTLSNALKLSSTKFK